ncbi:MAG: LysM peptidoglycan-binding domain-containing protein, partial [Gammaproteobacteria bacterium]|nr:LysM peptidoglycan-binding domain-containing protein [Gammaproteobacteria bacterium]
LSESLKDHYDLIGVRVYTVRSGDSPWRLAKRHGFPLWLFYRLNPSLRNGELKLGQVLTLPNLKAKI